MPSSKRNKKSKKDKSGMGKYSVLSVIGEGAYGLVMKCRNKKSGEVVAMKKFKESGEADEAVRKTILREVKVLKMMAHAKHAVVQLLETFRRKGRLYLVFEFLDRNLLEVIEDNPDGVPPFQINQFIYQLCGAVQECHRLQVLHRDIKPENLLINQNNELKLCDFGFARVVDHYGDKLTDYVATRWYRPPELLVGDDRYGPGVDIWAIACIMAEMADGDPLFPGDSEIDQLFIIQKMLGPIAKQHLRVFLDNPRFMGLRFPDMSHPDTLASRFSQIMSPKTVFFMNHLLHMDPKKRPTAEQCMQNPLFDDVRKLYPHFQKSAAPSPVRSQKASPTSLADALSPNVSPQRRATTSLTTALSKDTSPGHTRGLSLGTQGMHLLGSADSTPLRGAGHKKVESFSIGMSGFPNNSNLPNCSPDSRDLRHPHHGDHRRAASESLNVAAAKTVASFAQLHIQDQHYGSPSSFPGIDERSRSLHAGMGLSSPDASPPPMGHRRKVSSDFSSDSQVLREMAESKRMQGDFMKKTTAFSFGIS